MHCHGQCGFMFDKITSGRQMRTVRIEMNMCVVVHVIALTSRKQTLSDTDDRNMCFCLVYRQYSNHITIAIY